MMQGTRMIGILFLFSFGFAGLPSAEVDGFDAGSKDLAAQYKAAIEKVIDQSSRIDTAGEYYRSVLVEGRGSTFAATPVNEPPKTPRFTRTIEYKSDGVNSLIHSVVRKPGNGRNATDKKTVDKLGGGRSEAGKAEASKTEEYIERITVSSTGNDFTLRKNDPSSPFYIEYNTAAKSLQNEVKTIQEEVIESAYTVSGVKVTELLTADRVKTFEKVDNLYKLSFELSSDLNHDFGLSGWILVNPSLSWAICEFLVDKKFTDAAKDNYTHYSKIIYQPESIDKMPIPKEIYARIKTIKGANLLLNYRPTRWTYGKVPPEVFTLEGHGLGVLDKTRTASVDTTVYWAIGIGIVSLIASILLKLSFTRKMKNEGQGLS